MICRICPRCRKMMYSASAEEENWRCIHCGALVSDKDQVHFLPKEQQKKKGKRDKSVDEKHDN